MAEKSGPEFKTVNTWGDSDVISSFLYMPTVLAAMMWGNEI